MANQVVLCFYQIFPMLLSWKTPAADPANLTKGGTGICEEHRKHPTCLCPKIPYHLCSGWVFCSAIPPVDVKRAGPRCPCLCSCYFFFLLSLVPATPAMPVPNRRMVAGTGTGLNERLSHPNPSLASTLIGWYSSKQTIPAPDTDNTLVSCGVIVFPIGLSPS